LGVTFSDSDTLIEKRLGVSIRDFFEAEGEQRFREVEGAMLDELTSGAETVISTGGGVVLRAENRRMLRERTVCIYLKTPPDLLFDRLRRDTRRPLLQVADPAGRLRELSDERDPLYREAASFEIETRGKSLNMLVDAILRELPNRSGSVGDRGHAEP
jgi:shikimate kinase